MQKSEIKVGEEYGLREARARDAVLQHVRVLQHARGKKWKVEWIEPNPGLVDYIESQDVIVRWKDRKAFLRDEERERQLRADNERAGYQEDSPLAHAIYGVFDALGDKEIHFYRGVLSGVPAAIARAKERFRLDPVTSHPLAYVDRYGTARLPFAEVLELARAFCAVEPNTVLLDVEATESKWSQEASQPGKDHMVGLLNEYRAAWAIVRQWTGHDPAIAAREGRIQRLERLVWDAIYALQKAGLDQEAHRLRRAIERA
jgi:hypothetical protein